MQGTCVYVQQYKWAGLQLLAGSRPHKALKGLRGVGKRRQSIRTCIKRVGPGKAPPIDAFSPAGRTRQLPGSIVPAEDQAWCRQPGLMLHAAWLIQHVTGEGTRSAWHSAAAYINNGTVQSWPASQC